MPGYDGTGPRGGGAMTGRGLGYCATPVGSRRPGFNRLGWGRGFGRPFGWGRGMGYGRGFGYGRGLGYGQRTSIAGPQVDPAPVSAQDELAALREEAQWMEDQLKQIRSRMDELG